MDVNDLKPAGYWLTLSLNAEDERSKLVRSGRYLDEGIIRTWNVSKDELDKYGCPYRVSIAGRSSRTIADAYLSSLNHSRLGLIKNDVNISWQTLLNTLYNGSDIQIIDSNPWPPQLMYSYYRYHYTSVVDMLIKNSDLLVAVGDQGPVYNLHPSSDSDKHRESPNDYYTYIYEQLKSGKNEAMIVKDIYDDLGALEQVYTIEALTTYLILYHKDLNRPCSILHYNVIHPSARQLNCYTDKQLLQRMRELLNVDTWSGRYRALTLLTRDDDKQR